jgi:hypothetical protein
MSQTKWRCRRELGQVFTGLGADRLRMAIRHRRATLWHLAGVPIVEAATWLGPRRRKT